MDEYSYQQDEEDIARNEVKTRQNRAASGKKNVEWRGEIIIDDGRRAFYWYMKTFINIPDIVSF